MGTIRKAYILVLAVTVLLVIQSCNKREDYFKVLNIEPIPTEIMLSYATGVVDLKSSPNSITDTIKLTKKSDYTFTVQLEDESETKFVSAIIREGLGSSIANSEYIENEVEVASNKIVIKYIPNGNGNHVVDYQFKDIYDKVTIVRLRLFCFGNNKPVAKFTYINTQLFDPNEYRISASNSFDPDSRFGGGLSEYEYTIGLSYFVSSTNSYLDYIFSISGTYAIKVRVKDNDGVWSDPKTNIIVIN